VFCVFLEVRHSAAGESGGARVKGGELAGDFGGLRGGEQRPHRGGGARHGRLQGRQQQHQGEPLSRVRLKRWVPHRTRRLYRVGQHGALCGVQRGGVWGEANRREISHNPVRVL